MDFRDLLVETLGFIVIVFMSSLALDAQIPRAASISITSGILFALFREVYWFPKRHIDVEEDLKNLDEEGRPKRRFRL